MRLLYFEDHLVRRFRDETSKQISYHGKRVPNNCPLTREEIRTYVKIGPIMCIRLIRDRLNCSIKEAKDLLDSVRGENVIWKPRLVN